MEHHSLLKLGKTVQAQALGTCSLSFDLSSQWRSRRFGTSEASEETLQTSCQAHVMKLQPKNKTQIQPTGCHRRSQWELKKPSVTNQPPLIAKRLLFLLTLPTQLVMLTVLLYDVSGLIVCILESHAGKNMTTSGAYDQSLSTSTKIQFLIP